LSQKKELNLKFNSEISNMLLNKIWLSFFLVSILTALIKLIGYQDTFVFKNMVDALFNSGKVGFEIAIGLTGAMCIWMGIMQIGEKGGAINLISKLINPLFKKLFPEIPENHPATGAIMMNVSANMLGLDNAATPLGLKAMHELQTLNKEPETATNAQIMFLVLNTSGLTIIPVSVMATLAAMGSKNPSEIFLPILIATFCSTLVGLIAVSIKQKIKLYDKVIVAYLGGIMSLILGLLIGLHFYPQYTNVVSNVGGNLILMLIIFFFFILGIRKKVNLYEEFIEGAKGGFNVAIGIIPYLIAMLLAISLFRASGAFEVVIDGLKFLFISFGMVHLEFVDALPVALMKPLSGSGARGMMVEVINNFKPEHLTSKIAAILQGSTETTFYVLAVYFGAVKIKNTRYALGMGLIADLAGIISAILISYYFFS
jgi:spore maturation protein SpmA